MATTYKSKIDTWLLVVMILAVATSILGLVTLLTFKETPLATVFLLATVCLLLIGIILPVWLLLGTKYVVDADRLLITSGPLRWNIPIASIREITDTSTVFSNPALSLDRIRIEYGNGRFIFISPLDKTGFLREIQSLGVRVP